jgi:poly(A) polymerase
LFQDPLRHDFQWTWLFEPFPYDQKYQQFLRIALCAPTFAELRDWAGWVKSRFRILILKVLTDATVLFFPHDFAAQSHGSLIAGNIEQEHTNSVKFPLVPQLERAGIECDPCPLEEVDHTDSDPNVVFYWGLIPERIIQVDTSALKEDFMEDITNDVYGTVKCTHSDVTISVVGLPQLPKSMCIQSVHWQYMQHCMMGYEGTDEGQSAGWLGLG